MPAKSMAQYRLMQAVIHDPAVRKRTGINMKVAEEFTQSRPAAPGKVKAGAIRNRKKLKD